MKKTITILMVVLAAASLFALDNFTYKSTSFSFRPSEVRSEGMGRATLAVPGKMEAFYSNPAALTDRKFGLEFPSVTLTMYNVSEILSDKNIDWKHITEKENLIQLGTDIINSLGKGRNEVLTADIALGLKFMQVGFATNVHIGVHAFRPTTQTADQMVIPEVDIAQSVALGLAILETTHLKLDVGISGHFVFKTYMLAQNANNIINKASGDSGFKEYITNTPFMGGYAIPFDFGATLTAFDSLKISATVNNINGNYKMNAYGSALGMVEKLTGKQIDVGEDYNKEYLDESIKIETPTTVNLAFALNPDVKILDPCLEIDFVDIAGLVKDFNSKNLLKHMNIGGELHVTPVLALRAGANAGNLSFGAQLNLFAFQVDAAYGWMELGEEWGDKRTDYATIRINIGSDK
jgi:hypothetical protein